MHLADPMSSIGTESAFDARLTLNPPFPGIPELRAAIAADTAARHALAADPRGNLAEAPGRIGMVVARLVEGGVRAR